MTSPQDLPFPISTWGRVEGRRLKARRVERVRIDESTSGFFVLTREREGLFDRQLPSAAEVVAFLDGLDIRWDR